MPSWSELLDLTLSRMVKVLLCNSTYGTIVMYALVIVWLVII